jgi:hypothetical protein
LVCGAFSRVVVMLGFPAMLPVEVRAGIGGRWLRGWLCSAGGALR